MHRFKYVLNNTKVGMAVWSTKDHRLKFINPAFAYIYGYEPSELLGADVRHIFTPEYMQCFSECTNNPSYNLVEDTSFKTIHTHKDGSIVPLNVHITTIKDTNGAAKHHIANIINISNHKKTDAELAIVPNVQESELLRSIVQNVPGFAFIFTLHPDGKEEFLYASDKVLDTYGIDAPTVLSDITILRNIFHPEDMPHFRAIMAESAKTLQPFHAEFRINHPQKGLRWLESNSIPTVQPDGSIVWHGITMDVTSRKAQEEATAQKEREFSTMTNNMPDNVARWDTQGRYLSINAIHAQTLKMPASEVIGKSIFTIVPHHTEVIDALFSIIETKKDAITIFQSLSNEMGKIETHEVKLISEKNAQGEVISILGIGRDITEQKKLQENLLLKEFALDKINDAVYLIDKDSMFHYVNEAACRDLGYSKEELLTMGVVHIDPNMSIEWWRELWKGIEEFRAMTSEHKRKDGTLFPIEVSSSSFEYNGMSYSLAIVRDITERKTQEEQLAKKEAEFRSLTENSPDPIFRYDRECRRTYVNPAVERMTGMPASKLLGETPVSGMIIPKKDALNILKSIQKVLRTREINTIETLFIAQDEREIYFQNTHVPEFASDGSIESVISIVRDITAIKKQQEVLETLKKSEARYQLNNNLLTSVLESSTDIAIFALDTAYNYLTFNAKHKEIMEHIWGQEIHSGINILEIITCETDRKLAKESFDRAFLGESFSIESVYGDDTLSRNCWHIFYSPIYGVSGEISGVTCFNMNVTVHKETEEKLHEMEAKHSLVFQESQVALSIFSLDRFMYIEVNNSFLCYTGYIREEIIECTEVRFWEDREASERFIEEIQITGKIENFEFRYCRKDGTVRIASVYGTLIELNGEWCIIAETYDITERKTMEEQVLEQNQFLDSLLNAIPVPVFYKDKETRYKGVNKAFEVFYGKKKEDMIGKGVFDLFPREQAQVFFDADADLFRHGGTQIYEAKLRDILGIDHEVMFYKAVYFDKAETVIGQIGTILDITERKQMEGTLAKREQEFRALAEQTPDTIARYDKDCIRLYANPAFVMLSGMRAEELIGIKPTSHNSSQQANQYEEKIKKVLETGIEGEFELTWSDKMGRFITSHIRIIPEKNAIGNVYSVLAIGRDITKLKEFEIQLKENEIRLKEAQKIAKIGSWELEFPELRLVISDELYHLLKIDPTTEELSFDHFLNIVHPDDRRDVEKHFLASIKNNTPFNMIHRVFIRNKKIKYIHSHAKTFYDTLGKPIRSIGTVQDITDQKLTEKKIKFLAHHDTLTGLPNRRLVMDRIEQAIACAKRNHTKVALIFIDMDEFKTINDSLGHSIGDSLLKAVASRLQADIRETDTISRQGGDEFLIVLTDIKSAKDVSKITNKLLENFKKPFHIDSHTLSPSISIGIAMYPDDSDNFEMLLRNADTAMYKAKEAGGNDYCFFKEQMNNEITEHLHILNDLKNAIANNEFLLHYQPQVDLASHKINGIEALLRWNHPEHGLISPMKFIPIAESSGLIIPIGEWVAKEACRQAALWCKQGINVTVAINISAVQFKRGNLEETIQKALLESGLAPEYLELELTESILIHDTDKVLKSVQRLKELGIKLSIDDFGTGYSSLAYLKRFAVDKLKIDRSFIKDIFKDQEDAIIVKTIIQMAKSLNLKTIAEGVETKEVLEIIKSHGCDEVQGFYFAKPMCAEDFVSYFSQREFTL